MPRAGLAVKLTALVCYLLALAGTVALALRVLALGLDLVPPSPPAPWVWAIDLGWLFLFGVQHSVMARESWKRRWLRVVPARLERSLYSALSGLLLLGLALTWQPLDGPDLWRGPWWLIVVPLAAALGLVLVNASFDHAGLFGLRQAWESQPTDDVLLIVGPYRYLRHPLMACLLVFLWTQPIMTPTLALLAGGLSVYIGVGLWLEERDLSRRFHPAYAEYRRRVPALIPWRSPHPPNLS